MEIRVRVERNGSDVCVGVGVGWLVGRSEEPKRTNNLGNCCVRECLVSHKVTIHHTTKEQNENVHGNMESL